MRAFDMTAVQAAKKIHIPLKEWPGNCYAVAHAFAMRGLVPDGVAVYGHWLGPVAPGTLFHGKHRAGFCQHGWVKCGEAYVIDPTRYVFEGSKPYIYQGPADYYDEGGNRFRSACFGTPPAYSIAEKQVAILTAALLPWSSWRFVEAVLHISTGAQPERTLSMSQLFWLSNLAPELLEDHAEAVYRMLKKLGKLALMPIDNQRWIERRMEEGKR